MIEQQSPQFSIGELGAKFGAQLAQAHAENITLEKTIQTLQSQIQMMTQNEKRLADHIEDLENDLASLRVELDEMVPASLLSAEAAEIAAQGSAIIKENAAPG